MRGGERDVTRGREEVTLKVKNECVFTKSKEILLSIFGVSLPGPFCLTNLMIT